MKKIILATLLGFVASFVFGMLMFTLYYDGFTKEMIAAHPACMNTEPNLIVGFSSALIQSALTAFCFDKMKYNTLAKGAINGLWFSALIWLIVNLNQLAIFSVMQSSYLLIDTSISAVWGAVSGAAIGWALNKFQ